MFRKPLVASCAAALAFAACEPRPSSTPSTPTPPPRAEARAPLAPVLPDPVTIAAVPEKPLDPLALEPEPGSRVDHMSRAQQLKSDGDLVGALAEARRSLWSEPEDEETLRFVARVGRQLKERKLAAQAYERLARVYAQDPAPLVQQGRLLLELGELDEALVVAALAESRDAQDPEVFQLRGRSHLMKGELATAIGDFQKVLELSPDHPYALNNLGLTYLRSNQNAEAAEVLTRAAELLPTVAYVHNNLGVALERLDRMDDATLAYDRATALSPKYVKALVNSARARKVASAMPAEVDEAASSEE